VLELVGTNGALVDGNSSDRLEESASPSKVSSSKIRQALMAGQLADVEEALGRPYQLTLHAAASKLHESGSSGSLSLASSSYSNQPPGPGEYRAMASVTAMDCHNDMTRQVLQQTLVTVQLDSEGCLVSGITDPFEHLSLQEGVLMSLTFARHVQEQR